MSQGCFYPKSGFWTVFSDRLRNSLRYRIEIKNTEKSGCDFRYLTIPVFKYLTFYLKPKSGCEKIQNPTQELFPNSCSGFCNSTQNTFKNRKKN